MAREYFWWIIAQGEGKPYLIFGASEHDGGENEARRKGLEMLGGLDFILKRFPTRDIAKASQFYRGKRLADGEGLQRATQRIGHNRSLRRLRRRREEELWS